MSRLWDRFGFYVLVAGCLVAGFLGIRTMLRPAILNAHTMFLFNQFDMTYRESVASGLQPFTTAGEFIEQVSEWKIDWNSCWLHEDVIYDSWNTPVDIQISSSQIQLRSAGPDRRMNTSDDLLGEISNKFDVKSSRRVEADR